jgi:hypothetical protein
MEAGFLSLVRLYSFPPALLQLRQALQEWLQYVKEAPPLEIGHHP